jgi:hypothetical protein
VKVFVAEDFLCCVSQIHAVISDEKHVLQSGRSLGRDSHEPRGLPGQLCPRSPPAVGGQHQGAAGVQCTFIKMARLLFLSPGKRPR